MLDEPLQELREAPLIEAFPQVRGWARLGLNQRPKDYESPALTTELRARWASLLSRSGAGRRARGEGSHAPTTSATAPAVARAAPGPSVRHPDRSHESREHEAHDRDGHPRDDVHAPPAGFVSP